MEDFSKKYGLSANDREGLADEIKQKMSSLHPDKSGGEFKSEAEKKLYLRLAEAKDELEHWHPDSNQLVPVSVVKDLIASIDERRAISNRDALEEKLKTSISLYIDKAKKRFFLPRVSSAAIAAILSFIWLFPGTVKDHPVLGKWVDFANPVISIAWLYVLAMVVLFWAYDYLLQNRRERLLSILQEEQFQNELFERFLIFQRGQPESRFTKSDFINFLASEELEEAESRSDLKEPRKGTLPSRIGYTLLRRIDREMAADVADIVISRAKENGVIKPSVKKAMSALYELSDYDQV